ncbi:MAG TPA: DUF4410 domain-containing protein [Acidobacteriota bacterium]|jgi:hypothetical protein
MIAFFLPELPTCGQFRKGCQKDHPKKGTRVTQAVTTIGFLNLGGEKHSVFLSSANTVSAEESSKPKRRLLLSAMVIEYAKGSRAKRYLIGFGAGSAKVTVRFVFRDEINKREIFRTDCRGKFYGIMSFVGGNKEEAVSEAAGDVVDSLFKKIKKNR